MYACSFVGFKGPEQNKSDFAVDYDYLPMLSWFGSTCFDDKTYCVSIWLVFPWT